MEKGNDIFCISGKTYEIIEEFDEDTENLMLIIDEQGSEHELSQDNYKNWFLETQ